MPNFALMTRDASIFSLSLEAFSHEALRLLSSGASLTFTPSGGSMFPFIVGDMDKVTLLRESSYAVGDIVLAQCENALVLHRIISVKGPEATLMGDGNLAYREHCPIEKIYGRVTRIEHRGRWTDCDSKSFHLKSWLWRVLLPLRRVLLPVLKTISK